MRDDRTRARLHDIGKVAIPDWVMQKSTPLTDGERAIVQTHAATGADLLAKSKVSYAWTSEETLLEILDHSDTQFAPSLVSLFVPLVRRLREEHEDLDAYLGAAAASSLITLARRKIAESLARPLESNLAATRQRAASEAKLAGTEPRG